jgi:hypothetical protein
VSLLWLGGREELALVAELSAQAFCFALYFGLSPSALCFFVFALTVFVF